MLQSLVLLRNSLLALHLLALAVWVGGMFTALVVLRPAVAALEPAARTQFQLRVLKRFFFAVWHAMPIMLLTGWVMVFAAWSGFTGLPWPVNAMQAGGLLMAAVFLTAFYGPWQRLRRAIRPAPEQFDRVRTLMRVNLALGVLTVILGSLGHTW